MLKANADHVQTSAGVPETVDVSIATADAIAVGQTLRTLTRTHKVPPGVAEILHRVGGQMLASAMAVMP